IVGRDTMGILDILMGGAGARGGAQGGSGGGNMTKVGMALIAYMLWRWYQNSRAGGGAEPAPMPLPDGGRTRMPQQEPPAQLPHGDSLDIPQPRSGSSDDNDFGPLIESTRRMPSPSSGGGRGRMEDDGGMGGGGLGGGGLGGGLGDILNDILT